MNELENLVAQGAAIDAGIDLENQEAAGVAEVPGNPDAQAMEWVIVPEILAWVITTIYPETKPNYTEGSKMDLARKIAPVAEKYGLNGLGDSPELMLCIGAVGFAMPAYLAHKARKQLNEVKDEKDAANGSPE